MSIYKSKNSPWWQYDFQFAGVRFHGSTGTAIKAKALQIEAIKRTEAAGGGARKRPPMTLNEACGRYFVEVAEHQSAPQTTAYRLENLITGLGAETLLSDIGAGMIAEYVARRRAHVANASVNRETQILRQVFRRADKTWIVDIGDMPDWGPLLLTEPAGRVRELKRDEEVALFANLREDYHPLVRFALITGVRFGNARLLTWSQVDFENREILLRTKSIKPGGQIHMVPITQAMLVLLAAQRGKHPIYVFTYVCRRSRGKRRKGERYPFSQDGWRGQWQKALKAAGIEDFRFHDTRHTAATRTLRASNNLKVVQTMLGHADITTTARYAHAMKDDVRAAMEAVESRNSPEPHAAESPKSLKKRSNL